MRVLVVEDDDRVAAALRAALERHEMQVERVSRGLAVLPHLAGADVVLLDLGLPDVDGLEVCRRIREAGDVPVIVVSARGRVDERILGLHHGADDYLVKPYDVGELVARIHAVRRRRGATPAGSTPTATVAELGDGVVLDRARHALTVDGDGGRALAQGVRRPRAARRRRRRRVHPRPAGRRGLGPPLAGRRPDARRPRRHPAHQARPPGMVATVRGVGLPARWRPELRAGTGPERVRTRLLVVFSVLVGLLVARARACRWRARRRRRRRRGCSPTGWGTPRGSPRSPSARSRDDDTGALAGGARPLRRALRDRRGRARPRGPGARGVAPGGARRDGSAGCSSPSSGSARSRRTACGPGTPRRCCSPSPCSSAARSAAPR